MKRKLMLLLACLFVGIGLVTAQTQKVTGVVISEEDGQPVIGASVLVKGTQIGTITGVDGDFTLPNVPSSAKTLQISFIGMQTQEVAIKPNVRVVMKSESELLEEVMVVAYGTAAKKAFTGSATQVSGDKISMKSPTEVSKALQGEVAGVQVINTSGQPGTNATIRIRGIGSVNSSNAPLYVVDGIPFGAELSGINPSDIESTTVLKDATATALYGSRAANGVVLITTKRGEKGKTRVEAEVKYGANVRWIPLYETIQSPERYVELTWEGLRNRSLYKDGATPADAATTAGTSLFDASKGIDPNYNMWKTAGDQLIDPATGKFKGGIARRYTPEKWEDYLFRTGQKVQGDVKISGGSDKITYFNSLGYIKDEGYYLESDFQRFNARSNINLDLTSWLKSSLNMAYANMTVNQPGQTDSQNNGFQFVNFMPSLFPVFARDADGNKIPDEVVGGYLYDYGIGVGEGRSYASGINPAGAVQLDKDESVINQFNGNLMLEARFLKDFKATVNLGVQYFDSKRDRYTNAFYGDAKGLGRIRKTQSNYMNVTGNQILTYTKSIDKHNFEAFVAHEGIWTQESYIDGQKSLTIRPKNTEWANAVIMDYMDSDTYGYSMESFFGQVRYDFDEKYFFNASIRRDGSSRFSKGNKWGTFGSVGAAWLISKEEFMSDLDWLKELKLKASWGLLGNQALLTGFTVANYYPYEDFYEMTNQNNKPSFSFKYKGNPDLTWEKSSTFNTGLEFDIAGVLDGEIEYFHKSTTDMLFMKQVSPSLGYASYPVNDGKLTNHGLEFSLNAHLVKTNNVKFDVRLNGGYYVNKMSKMPIDDTTGKEKPVEVHGAYAWAKGHSLYDFYLHEYQGVNKETGLAEYTQYVNVKADGTREIIEDMEDYRSKNTIVKLEKGKTNDTSKATKIFVDKSAIPALSGGFGFDLEVKGLEFSTTFTYGLGGYALDYVYRSAMGNHTPGQMNWHKDIEARWQKPGDVTDVPRLTAGYDTYANSTSTRFLTSRSFLNLASARIGYTLPKAWLSKANIKGMSVYVTGDNLFLLSARKGFVAMSSVAGESGRSQYLPVTTIMGGLKIEF